MVVERALLVGAALVVIGGALVGAVERVRRSRHFSAVDCWFIAQSWGARTYEFRLIRDPSCWDRMLSKRRSRRFGEWILKLTKSTVGRNDVAAS